MTDSRGWVSVPREPTLAMLQAGGAADYTASTHVPEHIADRVWKAMLSAAPAKAEQNAAGQESRSLGKPMAQEPDAPGTPTPAAPIAEPAPGSTGQAERRQGHSALRGRPLNEDGAVALEVFDPHPSPPHAAEPSRAGESGCPCVNGAPCSDDCTCLNPLSSRGCAHCCSYGSAEQRTVLAHRIAALLSVHAGAGEKIELSDNVLH